MPSGSTLPHKIWQQRHRALLALLGVLAVGLTGFALSLGVGIVHAVQEGGAVAIFIVAAAMTKRMPRLASTFVSVGLMSASAVLVHLSGGMIEAHFLFFVLILLLTLYEDWVPFLVAAGFVLVHHGIAGTLDPGGVYNHPDAIANPWKWASIHALFITGAGLAGVTTWRLNEEYRGGTQRALLKARRASDRSRKPSSWRASATSSGIWPPIRSSGQKSSIACSASTLTPSSRASMATSL